MSKGIATQREVANRFAQERERLKLSSVEVARFLGVGHSTPKRWEAGTVLPAHHLADLKQIGFDPHYVLFGERSMPVYDEGEVEVVKEQLISGEPSTALVPLTLPVEVDRTLEWLKSLGFYGRSKSEVVVNLLSRELERIARDDLGTKLASLSANEGR